MKKKKKMANMVFLYYGQKKKKGVGFLSLVVAQDTNNDH